MINNFIAASASIGSGTKVWHFAVVLDGSMIGEDCSIGSGCEIGKNCLVGHNSRIGAHVFLPPNSRIGRSVFIGPGCVFTDDRYPVVNSDYLAMPPTVEDGASIGAGAVILPGVTIGAGALVGAGAIVTKNVAARTKVRGQPAKEYA